jgi:hypothetical protein
VAGDDACGKRIRQARAAGPAGDVILDFSHAGKSVADRAVAGAPAQVALERMRQVRPLLFSERSRRHDHARCAKAALERLRVQEGLLHRMQRTILRQPFDRGHRAPGGAERRHQAGMNWNAVEPHGAGAAVTGVATFLHAEHAAIAQKGAQALSGRRRGGKQLAIDVIIRPAVSQAHGMRIRSCGVFHARAPDCASSARICSAK